MHSILFCLMDYWVVSYARNLDLFVSSVLVGSTEGEKRDRRGVYMA